MNSHATQVHARPLLRALLALALSCASGCDRPTPTAPAQSPAAQSAHARDAAPVALASDAEVPIIAMADDAALHAFPDVAAAPGAPGVPDPTASWSGFLGGRDDTPVRLTCNGSVEKIERNRGGSTLSFRVWFTGGARGLFKPQQTNSVANFRAELAAYRMSKLLGLNRVPPACGRTISRDQLQRTADASGDPAFSDRVMKEVLARGEQVPGAMLYWVPGPLENVPLSPEWKQWLDGTAPLPTDADQLAIAADLSRLVVFDYLIDNIDRWSGGNILRRHPRNEPAGPMLFMDNGASFTIGEGGMGARPKEQIARLAGVVRFSRGLVAKLRALKPIDIQQAMGEDPLGTVLTESQVEAVLLRRDRVIEQADEAVAKHGEAVAYAFP